MKQKNDLIWSLLVQHLSREEWGKVSLSVGASPEEIKAHNVGGVHEDQRVNSRRPRH